MFPGEYEPPDDHAIERARPLEVATPPRIGPAAVDIASLARLARELGPRDPAEIEREATAIGQRLGAMLPDDPKAESTGAYYRWSVNQGGRKQTIEGPTIDLMDSLASVWGRLVYQIEITDEQGQRVTLRARVIDLVSLVIHERPYVAHLRPAPAKFARSPDEVERWRTMQLSSAESKAIRGVLERVIPAHVIDTALRAAREAAAGAQLGVLLVLDEQGRQKKDGKGNPLTRRASLPEAISVCVSGLGKMSPPIPLELAERWLGRPSAQWLAPDIGALRGLARRWKAGEINAASLAAEIAEVEAASEQPETETEVLSDDRLDDLLGPSAPTTSTSTSGAAPSPAHRAASPAQPTSGAPSTTSTGPSTTTSSPTVAGPKAASTDERRARVTAELDELRQSYGPLVADLAAPLGKITTRTSVDRLEWLVRETRRVVAERQRAAAEAARAAPVAPVEQLPAEPEWQGPVGAELVAEVQSLARDLGPDLLKAALRHAGIPAVDGAPEPALRRVLEHLLGEIPT